MDSAHYLYQRPRQELSTGKMLQNHNQRLLEMKHASLDEASCFVKGRESCSAVGLVSYLKMQFSVLKTIVRSVLVVHMDNTPDQLASYTACMGILHG